MCVEMLLVQGRCSGEAYAASFHSEGTGCALHPASSEHLNLSMATSISSSQTDSLLHLEGLSVGGGLIRKPQLLVEVRPHVWELVMHRSL